MYILIYRFRIFSRYKYRFLKVKLNMKNCFSCIIICRKKNVLELRVYNRNKFFLILKI